jgi:putative YphP/YqiW family bacilliredoxin
MSFPELMIRPMREELTRLGLQELRDAAAVDAFLASARAGTALIAVNSTCGCAAGSMRPALAHALRQGPAPDHLATVFAGQDLEATERAREAFTGYAPSSPSLALFRNGAIVWMMERSDIQGRPAEHLAVAMVEAFREHCEDDA